MPINNINTRFIPAGVTGNTNRPNLPNGGMFPNMPGLGANQLIQQRLLETVTFLYRAPIRAENLNAALADLSAAFSPRTVMSNNTNALQITSFTPPAAGQTPWADSTMIIHQIATAQTNQGTELPPNEPVEPDFVGIHTIEIAVGNQTKQISFEVPANATNADFQKLMSTAINDADLGDWDITATLANNALTLTSAKTGEANAFTITDITGNAAELTGIANVSQAAADAIFTLNGGEQQTSPTNRVDLGNGLIVTLVSASETEVGIFMGQDSLAMRGATHEIVQRFNLLLNAALENSADRNTRMLANDLQRAARFARRDFERIGITMRNDGTLAINENALNTAIQNGNLERFFTGNNNRGPNAFVSRLQRISSNVIRNPFRQVTQHALRLPGFNAAMDAINGIGPDPNTTGLPNQQAANAFGAYMSENTIGTLFDGMQ
ncbi:MAG: hypothetical protein FWG68_01910 [Defluviitaleaceae bacterium]|nr:hypothetical protein [Defluviitaleaceae bacterium]